MTDALGATSARPAQTLNVSQPLSITTTALPDATQLSPYSAPIASSGGRGPFTWTTPPTGTAANQSPESFSYANTTTATITASGATSSAVGTRNLTFTVTDADGRTATKTVNLNIVGGTPGASRSLISAATFVAGIGGTPTSFINAGVAGSAPTAAQMLSIAKDETVYATSSPGSSVYKGVFRGDSGMLFGANYTFSQPVLISQIDQAFAGPESPSGCTSARMDVTYQYSSDNVNWNSLGSTYSLVGSAYKIAANGYAGTYYKINAPVGPVTAQYVRMRASVSNFSGCTNSSSSWMFFSGVAK